MACSGRSYFRLLLIVTTHYNNFLEFNSVQVTTLPPPCYNTPVITDIKATVESATLGSGDDGGGAIVVDVGRELSGERGMLGSGGDEGGRTGSNCGGCGERAKWGESYVGIWW